MNLDNSWYYMGSDGRMQTGLIEVNGLRYYLNSDGRMATGIVTIDGRNYYFDPAAGGAMAVSRNVTADGVTYQADADGVLTEVSAETDSTASTDASTPTESGTAETGGASAGGSAAAGTAAETAGQAEDISTGGAPAGSEGVGPGALLG